MNLEILIEETKQHRADRKTFIKSANSIRNQMLARCRTIVAQFDADLAEAAGSEKGRKALVKESERLLNSVIAGSEDDRTITARLVVDTLLEAEKLINNAKLIPTKALERLAKELPAYEWSQGVRGLGAVTFAEIVAEAGDLSQYTNPDKLKKRMGLAVINGEAQRKCKDPVKAVLHGFSPQRRSLMYVAGDCLIRSQIRKDADGNRFSLGELGQHYIDSRLYAEENQKKGPHFWAKRRMEQRLLIQMWAAWNADVRSAAQGWASAVVIPQLALPSPDHRVAA